MIYRTRRRQPFTPTVLILGIAALLSACGGSAAAPSGAPSSPAASTKPASAAVSAAPASGTLTKIRFRYPVQTGAWIPFMIASDANIFQKYGLEVDVQILQSTLMVPAMLNKEMDIAGTSAETIVSAKAKGADLTIVGAMILTAARP